MDRAELREQVARLVSDAVYYHGGIAGLREGDLLVPSPPHVDDGCPICVARREGRVYTVGEYRLWLCQFGDRAVSVLRMLDGAHDAEPVDPPSAQDAVYITTDLGYARWYAARSRGDLYQVEPGGDLHESIEDHFPSFTVSEARVVKILERSVRLDRKDRRAMFRRWGKADRQHQQRREVKAA